MHGGIGMGGGDVTSDRNRPHFDEADDIGSQSLNKSLGKFVAGGSLPERSQFAPPSNQYLTVNKGPNALDDGTEPFICDVSTNDAQYERYKSLMKSKFYNMKANSTTMTGMALDQA